MNTPYDGTSTPSVASGDDDFDPHDAADLLAATRRDARRSFEPRTPLICAVSAVVVLAVYGTLWLSVRDQHPYVGPSLAAIGWVYAIVGVSAAVSLTVYRRARQGVSGRSRREEAIAGLAVGVPWIAVYVFDGALKADGFGNAIVYGVFDAAAPWLVVGTAMAALAAGREQWGGLVTGLMIVVIGTAAAFFGPAGSWGLLGVAGFVGLLALAVSQQLHLRHA
jgi:hypothetical protein